MASRVPDSHAVTPPLGGRNLHLYHDISCQGLDLTGSASFLGEGKSSLFSDSPLTQPRVMLYKAFPHFDRGNTKSKATGQLFSLIE